jgi:hypothetical protein
MEEFAMMNMNNSTASPLSERSWLHRYADLIGEEDLPEVKMIMQQYAAIELNRRYKEEQQQK